MNFLSFSIIFDVLETLDQRAFNALFRVSNNVLNEEVPPLSKKSQKTLQNSRIPGIWVHLKKEDQRTLKAGINGSLMPASTHIREFSMKIQF